MVKNDKLAKSILDMGWGQVQALIIAKAEEAGRMVIVVPPHGTSQTCSGCGEVVQKTVAVRTHKCPHCGLVLDRDVNAAINILAKGLSLIA
jgi:putative transposase